MWVIKIFRMLFAFIDFLVYSLIDIIYQLFILISEAGVFTPEVIQDFAGRIYVLLGLIMIFKVSISLVSYVLNPDNFSKADVGAPALLKGFAFALVGIVMVPYVFEAAFALQKIILNDNIIPNLILGADSSSVSDDAIDQGGKNIAFTTLSAFIKIETDGTGISPESKCSIKPAECSDSEKDIIGDDAYNLLVSAHTNKSIKDLTDFDLLNATISGDDKVFVVNYLFLISTLAGGFIGYILLLFCIDIAVRSVKLGFLQLIAPIPLIAKIDPKKGGKVFDNWIKECVSTYLDVFLRLTAIYFALFVITAIVSNGGVYNVLDKTKFDGVMGAFVQVAIIIGTLNFARDLPKLIGKITGIDFKGMGGFSLNPMKNKNLAPVGMALGTAGSIASSVKRGANENGWLGALGGLLTGGAGGLINNAAGFASGKSAQDLISAQSAKNRELNLASAQGSTPMGRLKSSVANLFGTPNQMDMLTREEEKLASEEKEIEESEAASKNIIAGNKAVNDSISAMETRAMERIKAGAGGELSDRYNSYIENLEKARNSGDVSAAENITKAMNHWINSNEDDGATSQYIDAIKNKQYTTLDDKGNKIVKGLSTEIKDGTMEAFYDNYATQCSANGQTVQTTGSKMHDHLSSNKKDNGKRENDLINADTARAAAGKHTKSQITEAKRAIAVKKRAAQANASSVKPSGGK